MDSDDIKAAPEASIPAPDREVLPTTGVPATGSEITLATCAVVSADFKTTPATRARTADPGATPVTCTTPATSATHAQITDSDTTSAMRVRVANSEGTPTTAAETVPATRNSPPDPKVTSAAHPPPAGSKGTVSRKPTPAPSRDLAAAGLPKVATHKVAGHESAPPTRRNGDIHDFFNAAHSVATRPQAARSASYGSKLPKIEITGLTPSQRLFSIATGINPLSSSIASGDEFFLFMNLRAEHQWVSFGMTPQKWVDAAVTYNVELEKLNRRLGHFRSNWATWKTPRALMEKLGEVEPMILRRLATGDYKCKLCILLLDLIADNIS